MGDKGGGKESSVPSKAKATKSSLRSSKSTSSNGKANGGKEDGSTKSKKTRKVQFDTERSSPVSTGKIESLYATATTKGKGGKGDKAGSTSKKNPAKPKPEPLELKVERDLPKNAECIMDAEAFQILQGIQDQMAILSEDPSIKIPISFDWGLQYARTTGNRYKDYQSVRRVLGKLKEHGVTEAEICVIANVCPETADEVFALVPSWKGKREKLMEPLKGVLEELAELKQST